jgi:diacylglycerol O-acyltransferase
MERMRGIDATFLYMETPTVHMHTLKVAVVHPTPATDDPIARLKADLRDRLHLLPAFRRRIVPVPLGFHHPVWIEDPDFDLDRHLRTMTLAPPGGPAEMDAAISRIASVSLPRDRPLWEITLLEGAADGRVPVVAKLHHALADGVAAAALLADVLDAPPERRAAPSWAPEAMPSAGRLIRGATRDHVGQLASLPSLLAHTASNLGHAARHRRHAALRPPRPVLDTPRAVFNGALTAERTFVSTTLPLGDVKAVKDALGVTVNDVLLAAVGGSVRAALLARDALPTASLVAEVPVATDPPGTRRLGGNRLSNIFTSLRTDVEDPVARARAIHEVTGAAKELHQVLGPDLYESWSQYASPLVFAWMMRLYSRARLADRHRPPVNLIVSSVPGPRRPLAWPGGTLDAIYSVGPIIEGAALNVTAWSYVDRLHVGVLSCPALVPDTTAIATGLARELAALRDAGAARNAGGSRALP